MGAEGDVRWSKLELEQGGWKVKPVAKPLSHEHRQTHYETSEETPVDIYRPDGLDAMDRGRE